MSDFPIELIQNPEELDTLTKTCERVIVNFHAPWAAPCAQMNIVFAELHKNNNKPIRFATASAEQLPSLTSRLNISSVPSFLCFALGRLVRRRAGADAAGLASDVQWLGSAPEPELERAMCAMWAQSGEITVIMKGTASRPRCGFSRQVVEILQKNGVYFETVDVLSEGFLREGMKKWAEWSSYPMVFARGKLVGGLDIIRQLADEGRLVEELSRDGHRMINIEAKKEEVKKVEKKEDLESRLKKLSDSSDVMVFMKGDPESPRCRFSRRLVELLKGEGVKFGSFDVLGDEEVRQGMKKFSDWPTFPQVYAKGRFVGGLDVLVGLQEAGELGNELGMTA